MPKLKLNASYLTVRIPDETFFISAKKWKPIYNNKKKGKNLEDILSDKK